MSPALFPVPGTGPQSASAGVTVLELTIAAAVVGILASVAVPRFASLVDGFRATAAAERLAVEFRKIQLRARAEGRSFVIRNGTTAGTEETVLALAVSVDGEALPSISVLADARLRVEDFGPLRVTSRGEFESSPGVPRSPVRFSLAEVTKTVFVQRSGRILVR